MAVTYTGSDKRLKYLFEHGGGGGGGADMWVGTQAEYEAQASQIADGTIVGITDDWEEVEAGGVLYSTVERCVGKWTDGKPLYEKTVIIDALPSTAYVLTSYLHNISNVNEICLWRGHIKFTSGTVQSMPTVQFSNNAIQSAGCNFAQVTPTTIDVMVGTDRSSAKGLFVIQYTKTTDSAIPIVSNVTPSYHVYSTEERVIGQWVDGSTLYERTITGLSIVLNGTNWVNYTGVSDIAKLINLHAYYQTTNGILSCAIAEFQALSNGGLQMCTFSSTFDRTVNILTIQYTKTS